MTPRPQDVSIYDRMAIQAARRSSHVGGGYRLYALGKALDIEGRGRIERDELKAYALELGVSDRQYRRWIAEARGFGIIQDVQAQDGRWMLILTAAGPAALALGMDSNIGRKVVIEAAALIGKGWKARIGGAYEAGFNGQPIARGTMQKVVNVSVSTQRYRDVQAGVKRTRNYAISNMRADQLASQQEYSNHKGLFVTGDGFISWRLPNSYIVPFALRSGPGRSRKASRYIRAHQPDNALLQKQQGLSCEDDRAEYVRLFNRTPKALKASIKRIEKQGTNAKEIYEQGPTARTGAQLWTPWGVG